MSARCLAPAKIQFLLSSFIFCMTAKGIEALLLKTLAFRSFHSSHVIRVTADFKPSGQVFTTFLQSSSSADTMFAEGSLFSPFLFGKFFDPVDAFPLWEFESDVLLAALRRGGRTTVDWAETDCEYYLRADIPGGKKCDVEVSGDGARVVNVSGLWCAPPVDGQDWRAGTWWEHGFVRRLEMPEDADGSKVEACFDDCHGSLEIKVPKKKSDGQEATA